MRTIEDWNRLLADDPRAADAWCHQTVLGLQREVGVDLQDDNWFRTNLGDGNVRDLCPHYTTDPAAAEQVRQRAANHPLFERWVNKVWALAIRRGVAPSPLEVVLKYGQPSDYVGAFWLLDADKELRQLDQ